MMAKTRESNEAELNRFLVAHASDVLLAASMDGTIEHASASSAVLLGVPPEVLRGTSVTDLVHPADHARAAALLTHVQWTGGSAEAHVQVENRRSATRLDVLMTVRTVSADGRNKRLHVTVADRSAQRKAEAALRSSERRFRGLTSQTSELVVDVDLGGTITYVSPSSIAVLGHSHDAATGRPITDFIHPDDFPDLLRVFVGLESAHTQRHRAIHADGSYRWLETLAQIIRDDDGERASVLLSSRDITDRLVLEARLERQRRLLTAIIENVHAGVIAVDVDGVVLCANAAFCRLFGTDFVPGTSLIDYRHTHELFDASGDPVDVADRPLEIVLRGGRVIDRMFVVGSADGTRYEVVANATQIVGSDGSITAAVLTYEDITALRSTQDELRSLATIDQLTDLPNRRHLVAHLEEAMRRNIRTPERLAVLFADLDGFKAVNDRLGHEAGDELLRGAGRRLSQALRSGDLVARYGGDEFVVVIEGDEVRNEAPWIARRIEHEMSLPFEVSCATVSIGSSIGVSFVDPADTLALVLARADAAMYLRKAERQRLSLAQPDDEGAAARL